MLHFTIFFPQIVQQEEDWFYSVEIGVEGSTLKHFPESQGSRLGVRCLVSQFGKRASSYAHPVSEWSFILQMLHFI